MDALPLDHARRIWPLYRPLLPRGTAESFDDWCQSCGLIDTFDTVLACIAGSPDPGH